MNPAFFFGAIGALVLLGGGVAVAGKLSEGQKKYIFWNRYDDTFKKYASENGLDWQWLKATAIVESSLGQNPLVMAGLTSSDNKSWGLMQFTLATANDIRPGTTIEDLNNPEISIFLAAKYLAQLKKRFPGDTRKAIISYNQGPGNTARGNDYTGDYWQKWSAAFKLVVEG